MKNVNFHTIWLFLVFFAFFYELPLVNLSFDRLNPRLIDVVTLLGIFIHSDKLGQKVHNVIYDKWRAIVYWFIFCSVISSIVLLSGMLRLFSLLAAFRYFEGLILIKLVLLTVDNQKVLLKAVLGGLIFDALYCIYQMGHPTTRELAPGVFVEVDMLTGPLSNSYFEIAQLLPTAVLMSLGLIETLVKKKKDKRILIVIAIACTWPILFTGSRTGLVLLVFSYLFYLLLQGQKRIVSLVLVVGVSYMVLTQINVETTEMYTISRTMDLEENEIDDVNERIGVGTNFKISEYDNAIVLPIFGAGFNIAPINGSPRIDYGVHSMFLYPFEQSGIVGLILFISFLVTCVKSLWKYRNYNKMALGALALILSMMVTGIGAHNFWRGFSSGNVNTLIIIFLCLAYKYTYEENKSIAYQ